MVKANSEFLWDVFLSHSSAQKPLVRAMVHQWRGLGLKVFFDEDTIQPGDDVSSALDRGCENSRQTVLMITNKSMASDWVETEFRNAIYLDSAARERRLIPVLLEPVPESELPVSVRRLSRSDLTNPGTRRQQYHYLLRSLGVTNNPLPEFPVLEASWTGLAAPRSTGPVLEAGAMPTDSPYYIERQNERRILELLDLMDPAKTIAIRGHHQSGKSSLLARLHARELEADRASCILDFQGLDAETLQTTDRLFPALAQCIADGLELKVDMGDDWSPHRGMKQNLTNFLEKKILSKVDRPVTLLFDEADLTFPYSSVRDSLFSTLRFWHNRRADKSKRTWRRLGLVVAHSTEPSLWITDVSQSPFNVADRIALDDFNEDEVAQLNERYGRPLPNSMDIAGLIKLVGGHPYLVRLALYTMATKPCTLAVLESAYRRGRPLRVPPQPPLEHPLPRQAAPRMRPRDPEGGKVQR